MTTAVPKVIPSNSNPPPRLSPGSADTVRLGHALRMTNADWDRGRDITAISKEAYRLASGQEKLVARAPAPQFKEVVEHAERQIGIDPHDPTRPVYAYIGDLHGHLGQVGLVFERGWANRCLHGFTRCDSGGMAGGMGNFQYAVEENAPWAESKNRLWAAKKRHENAVKAFTKARDVLNLWENSSHVDDATAQKLVIARNQYQAALSEKNAAESHLAEVRAVDDPQVSEAAQRQSEAAQTARDRAVRSITILKARVPAVTDVLNKAFREEIARSFDGARGYVFSDKPRYDTWTEPYRQQVQSAYLDPPEQREEESKGRDPRDYTLSWVDWDEKRHDRRVWTWEVRMTESPRPDELHAVILSPEGAKVFMDERLENIFSEPFFISASPQARPQAASMTTVQLAPPEFPDLERVKIITSDPEGSTQANSGLEEHTGGAPWFYSNAAREALLGTDS